MVPSSDEILDIIEASINAEERGDIEEAKRLIRSNFPMPDCIAMGVKESLGKEYLLNSGWDLSEAEETYGKDWLDKSFI